MTKEKFTAKTAVGGHYLGMPDKVIPAGSVVEAEGDLANTLRKSRHFQPAEATAAPTFPSTEVEEGDKGHVGDDKARITSVPPRGTASSQPVASMAGVTRVQAAKMEKAGIRTVGDLAGATPSDEVDAKLVAQAKDLVRLRG